MLTTNKKEKLMFIPTRFRNEKGAIDLSSIMVGIIVLGLIGGVIAATVFAVIPWAQDQAAKKQLQSVTVAQNAYAGLVTANKSSIALAAAEDSAPNMERVYGSLSDLNGEELLAVTINPDKPWLSADGKLCTNQTEDGFESAIQSASGNVFRTGNGKEVERVTDPAELNTTCLGVLDNEQPIEPTEEGVMKMTYTCPLSTDISVPGGAGFTGNIKFVVGSDTREADVTDWDGSGINLHLNKGESGTLTMKGEYAPIMDSVGDFIGRDCLLRVDAWDADTGQENADGAFYSYRNLTTVPRPPATLNNMAGMFANAHSFNGNTRDWDVSNVTDMQAMFMGAYAFNQPVNDWDVSKVKNMNNMFAAPILGGAPATFMSKTSTFSGNYDPEYEDFSQFNQPMNKWNVANVTDMGEMFYRAHSFNQPINNWNVTNVTNMHAMFSQADSFNQNLNSWNVANVTDMHAMFSEASNFNGNISNWNISNVHSMTAMFQNAKNFNQNVNNWDVSGISDMTDVFSAAEAFNKPLNNWDVSNVTDMQAMFNGAFAFNQNINTWDVSSVKDMTFMFSSAHAFNQPLNNWTTSSLQKVYSMFSYTKTFNQNINTWDVSRVQDFTHMFHHAAEFDQPLNNWDLFSARDLYGMFHGARKFNQPLDQWDVSRVQEMGSLFHSTGLFQQNLNNWDMRSVQNVSGMFSHGAYNQPLNNWNVSNVKNFSHMFYENPTFDRDIRSWDTRSAERMTYMFEVAPGNPATSHMYYDLSGWNVDNIQQWYPFGPMPQAYKPQFIKSS